MKRVRQFEQIVQDRGRQLRQLSFSGLTEMATLPSQTVIVDGRKGEVSVIVESCGPGELKVIVQGFLASWFPRMKHVALDGFYKQLDGSISEMQKAEFYGYD